MCVCTCVFVCIYVCVHIYTYVCVHTHTDVYLLNFIFLFSVIKTLSHFLSIMSTFMM